MKNTFIILALITFLVACGENESSQTSSSSNASSSQPTKKPEKLLACSILSEEYIKSTYPGATISQMKEGGRTYPLCSARFKFNNLEYDLSLTLGVIGGADESFLESSVSYFKGKGKIQAIQGAGEKAYNRMGGAGQISALSNGNLIHVSAYIANKYDLELSKKITNDMFKELEK